MRKLVGVLLALISLASCIHTYSSLEVREIRPAEPTRVTTPVRAHLIDGSTVVYRTGVFVGLDSLRGPGQHYDVLLSDSTTVASVPMDSVLGLEALSIRSNAGKSTAVSVLATIGAIGVIAVGAVAIACAADPKCFGSCPTVYTMAPDGEVLEAELFSYSVAPLLEARDVDRIGTTVGSDGFVELEIRNEALETHRINYLGLLAVRHEPDEVIVPDARGEPVALSGLSAPLHVRDRVGRDISAATGERDSVFFASAAQLLADASVERLHDHIDLTLPPQPEADSVGIVLRLRNSLLNTILFYDLMLASAGAQALDWIGSDLQQIGPAIELGEWYVSRMGMWVSVHDGTAFRPVERIPDSGPIAWKDVAVVVPVTSTSDPVRIRLAFVVDEWRIDRIQVAARVRRPETTEVPVTEIVVADGSRSGELRALLSAPDEDYVETLPSQRFTARFDVGVSGDGASPGTRTFLVAAQGYYTEWIRPDWIRNAVSPRRFVPSDDALVTALERWRAAKDDFEERFYATRIPVR